jgi:hypothetical protein
MRQYTWAIKWNVMDLPSEELTCMNRWNMASTLLDGRSDGIKNIYFQTHRACLKWLTEYIKNVVRDNQDYHKVPLEATYKIFFLNPEDSPE